MKTLLSIFILALAYTKNFKEYPEWLTKDTVECNKIYPIAFNVPNSPNPATITAFDFQDLANYDQFTTNGKDNISPGGSQFAAILYWDNDGLKIGATYQTERAFIWVRQLTDASRAGQSTMRLSSIKLL